MPHRVEKVCWPSELRCCRPNLKFKKKCFEIKMSKISSTVLYASAHRSCVPSFVRIGQKTVGGVEI